MVHKVDVQPLPPADRHGFLKGIVICLAAGRRHQAKPLKDPVHVRVNSERGSIERV
jgi:uncharacterized protein (DUF2249 family)